MSNWDKLRMTSSATVLARWLETVLGDSVPTDWLAWLLEEAHEEAETRVRPMDVSEFAAAILTVMSNAAKRNSAPEEATHET